MPHIPLIKIHYLLILLLLVNTSHAVEIKTNKHQIFVCPMHNHIQKHQAGKCPICGMDLVLDKAASERLHSIILSTKIKHALNILTENVRTLEIQRETYAGIKLKQVNTPQTQITVELLKPNLKWLKQGSLVEAEAKEYIRGEHTWTGEISHITDQPDDTTHRYPTTINLRTPYDILKPNMYLTLTLYSDMQKSQVIPFKAVLFDSDKSTHVVKVVGKNEYQVVPITLGIRQDHLVEVINGLEEHDKVVTDGQFLIRAEKQLRHPHHD